MGIGPFSGRSCSVYPDTVTTPNPDPVVFEIIETWQVKTNVVAKIKYPNCTTYDGIKICVYKDFTCKRLYEQDRLDPHFSDEGVSPIARFKPTVEGLKLALELGNMITI